MKRSFIGEESHDEPASKFIKGEVEQLPTLDELYKYSNSQVITLFKKHFSELFVEKIEKLKFNQGCTKSLTGVELVNAVESYRTILQQRANNYTMAYNEMVNKLQLILTDEEDAKEVGEWLESTYILPFDTHHSNSKQELVKSTDLDLFLQSQKTEPKPNVSCEQGLFFTATISREEQLRSYMSGIIRSYIACNLNGAIGSGKTHFLLNALSEIINKMEIDKTFYNWAKSEFESFWNISNISSSEEITIDNMLNDLISAMKHSVKVFASQRGSFSVRNFQSLTPRQYIAALLAIQCLSPQDDSIFCKENFQTKPLSLDSVLKKIIEKNRKSNEILIIEIAIDEVQILIDNKDRNQTSFNLLIREIISITNSIQHNLLIIPIIAGTIVADQNILDLVSLSGGCNYNIILDCLSISDTLQLIQNHRPKEFELIEKSIPLPNDRANLLSLIGPFPRTVEMIVRFIINSKTNFTTKDLYDGVKNMLITKYSPHKESMIHSDCKIVALLLKYILEGKTKLKDDTLIANAIMRGILNISSSGKLSIIFIYLHYVKIKLLRKHYKHHF